MLSHFVSGIFRLHVSVQFSCKFFVLSVVVHCPSRKELKKGALGNQETHFDWLGIANDVLPSHSFFLV